MTLTATNKVDSRPLAVFDLDGTLVTRDTFLPFLLSYARKRHRLRPFLTLPVYLALYACRLLSDRAAKQRVLISFLRGQSKSEIAEDAVRFARTWVPPRLRAEVVCRLREHQKSGHRVVLLSASPDVYVPAIARELGISEVVCTRVAGDDTIWDGASSVAIVKVSPSWTACANTSAASNGRRSHSPMATGRMISQCCVGPGLAS